ncbi:tRNA (uridine(34)/cytosine(34)/5-carboxymethylaminomethyluridine(34)-2'-O)-methyltransferase TrmL [Peptostreptococcus anaerobius]|uniref:Putative tRNA (cytidine(34)-2'-O)-methyltransferase n=1 Tax=Peptostreptococcus porci TaxID=2652282 RepID=A0A6N7XB46_9FIRM|nr:tRNA (uridine(34)/cytosine(34)/5-carboxymethylaminomethyluridine(34)-2'-O)-methyltransferase TrmL [Peptostreptococcus porci]MDD7183946.1 tRNA (uridine(34)/cytosine(34)/5-carboxymethylaminomethyluridine(34)-2'-O)-methyltransferase TrmL [Peptostreptococcus porci]MDY4128232.1 tRNA (uridine(34)/cytosine(34)/5-carboxymethylaminomethyluridine(34)-2'-O)-methyltransferase TrmL [Peptostreptococcus porci]MDY5964587.1 tRNA (uridine(34)/cytosine(34)/5-carboxymethylaminomethyluridine(34)-2'-O)-methyltrans
MALNIVLYEPEIPHNTGNIIRTCANTGAVLHLIKPLGFSLDDKHLKRCGLDYWDIANIQYYDNFDELKRKFPDAKYYYSSIRGKKAHSEVKFEDGCFLVFGKETKGLPKEIIEENIDNCMRIPMLGIEGARCLNLSNSVAIVVYEALRQLGYPEMV